MRQPVVVPRALLCLLLCALGCSGPAARQSGGGDDAVTVKATFLEIQKAHTGRDAEKLWSLIDSDSQTDAERAAKAWREKYATAEADKVQKDVGVSAADLAKLTGKEFLKTAPFRDKHDELADSKMGDARVEGDQATVNYVEPDGDKEKLKLTRQAGQWKANLAMPMPK